MNFKNHLYFIFFSPLLYSKKILCRALILFHIYPPLQRMIGDIHFEIHKDLRRALPYFYEPETEFVLKKFLKLGDVFIDVGANLGYFSAMASTLVGSAGEVHAIEPVPAFTEHLTHLAEANPKSHLKIHSCAVGDAAGIKKIAVGGSANPGWNTLVLGLVENSQAETVDVRVTTLSEILIHFVSRPVRLIKIDVECFEYSVLRGFAEFIKKSVFPKPVIICELSSHACSELKYTMKDLSHLMDDLGYRAVSPFHFGFTVDVQKIRSTENVLFLPIN